MFALMLLACGPKYPLSQSRNVQLETFEVVWHTVQDVYPYEDMHGLDWQAVHDELLPQARKAKTNADLRPVLGDMLGRLGESHYGVLPGDTYERVRGGSGESAGSLGEAGEAGLEVRWVEDQLVVLRAWGPAAQAGITPGWTLVSIGDWDLTEAQQAAAELDEDPLAQARDIALGAKHRLSADVGSPVQVVAVDPQGERHELSLICSAEEGMLTELGHLPPIRTTFEHEVLTNNVHLIRFDVFMTTINEPMQQAMTEVVSSNATGVILDIRGNFGGVAGLGSGVAGYFTQERGTHLATMITRDGELILSVFPRPPAMNYAGPLAVLVDELSFSTSEILADGLQDNGRARIFGTPTTGLALPSVIEALPNGDKLQYVIADLVGPDGQRVEGAGVQPDELVPPLPSVLVEGGDPAVDAAHGWILSLVEPLEGQPLEEPSSESPEAPEAP